jgi:hypothetical protein
MLGEAPNVLCNQLRPNHTRNFSSPLTVIFYDTWMSPNPRWASPISYIPSSDSSPLKLPLTFERHADATDVTDVLQSVKEFDFWEVRTLVTCPSQLHTKSLIYDRQCDAAAYLISHASPPLSVTDGSDLYCLPRRG